MGCRLSCVCLHARWHVGRPVLDNRDAPKYASNLKPGSQSHRPRRSAQAAVPCVLCARSADCSASWSLQRSMSILLACIRLSTCSRSAPFVPPRLRLIEGPKGDGGLALVCADQLQLRVRWLARCCVGLTRAPLWLVLWSERNSRGACCAWFSTVSPSCVLGREAIADCNRAGCLTSGAGCCVHWPPHHNARWCVSGRSWAGEHYSFHMRAVILFVDSEL
jgi:hypothetical protein